MTGWVVDKLAGLGGFLVQCRRFLLLQKFIYSVVSRWRGRGGRGLGTSGKFVIGVGNFFCIIQIPPTFKYVAPEIQACSAKIQIYELSYQEKVPLSPQEKSPSPPD